MQRLVRISLALVGIGLLALCLTPITDKHVDASNPQSVIVSNTPLPVQGTVSVGNIAAVSVSNTPNVNVANMPSVNVANSTVPVQGNVTVSNPLDPSNNPVPVLVNGTPTRPYFDSCGHDQGFCDMSPVPSGYRLVIQTISMLAHNPGGDSGLGGINYVTNDHRAIMNMPLLNGVGNQAVTLYVDPNTQPECFQGGDGITGCTISGYLVPLQ